VDLVSVTARVISIRRLRDTEAPVAIDVMEPRTLIALPLTALLSCASWRTTPEPLPPGPETESGSVDPRDVIYVPTPDEVVDGMLQLAGVTDGDVVYDLGSGDGRIVIRAAERYGARGVGIEIDPELVAEGRRNAAARGVEHRVQFRQADLFLADIGEATVVTLYLGTVLNKRLRPKLLRDLRPGARVVSQTYGMGSWKAERSVRIAGRDVFVWTIPPRP
jgi:SAM-dependent methyltransferase